MTRHSASLFDALCHVLGNTCRMFRTTKSYEWNVAGNGAEVARQCFHTQADEMDGMIDPIADHILSLGGHPILDYSDAVVAINPPATRDIPDLAQMIVNLRRGHQQAGLSVEAALDVARDADELPTQYLLAERITAHRLHRRRLSLLGPEP